MAFIQAATRRCGPDLKWVFLLQRIDIKGASPQMILSRKIPHSYTQQLVFQFILDIVKLTTRIAIAISFGKAPVQCCSVEVLFWFHVYVSYVDCGIKLYLLL